MHEDAVGDGELTPAAVLVPIILHPGQPSVLLTQRTAHLRDHAGQISFPGGRMGPRTAARSMPRCEAEEGSACPRQVEMVGFCRVPDRHRL